MNTLLPWLICALALLSISIKYVIKGRPLYYKFLQVEDSHDHDKLIVENKLVAFSWLSPRVSLCLRSRAAFSGLLCLRPRSVQNQAKALTSNWRRVNAPWTLLFGIGLARTVIITAVLHAFPACNSEHTWSGLLIGGLHEWLSVPGWIMDTERTSVVLRRNAVLCLLIKQ